MQLTQALEKAALNTENKSASHQAMHRILSFKLYN